MKLRLVYQSTVRLSLLGSTLAPDFVTEGGCIIFSSRTGRGHDPH